MGSIHYIHMGRVHKIWVIHSMFTLKMHQCSIHTEAVVYTEVVDTLIEIPTVLFILTDSNLGHVSKMCPYAPLILTPS